MAEVKRAIWKSGFSVEKLASLEDEEARQYFLLNYFVPLAFNRWEMSAHAYAVCFLISDKGLLQPSVQFGTANVSGEFAQYAAEDFDRSSIEQTVGKIDGQAFSDALRKVFAQCLTVEPVYPFDAAPMIASIKNAGSNALTLNVMVKTKDRDFEEILFSRAIDGRQPLKTHAVFGRAFNALTGKWFGLCPDDDLCPKCQVIKNSKQADNAYAK